MALFVQISSVFSRMVGRGEELRALFVEIPSVFYVW